MNRRNRHLVVLLIAVVTASLASFAVYRTAAMPTRTAEATQQSVVVAARPLAMGTPLTAADVKVIAWPASSPLTGAIANVREVVNRGLLTAVLENEPLTANKLAAAHEGAGLPPAIPPGMRAMSVKVDDVIGVAGFVVPGSRVDVVVTMRKNGESVTNTVASNVQVMIAGTKQQQEKAAPDAKPTASTVVTLMVSPKDAERVALAQYEGQIVLVLRNPLDTAPTVTTGVSTNALLAEQQPPAAAPVVARAPRRVAAPPPPAEAPVVAPKRTVETIRAAKRSDEVIK